MRKIKRLLVRLMWALESGPPPRVGPPAEKPYIKVGDSYCTKKGDWIHTKH